MRSRVRARRARGPLRKAPRGPLRKAPRGPSSGSSSKCAGFGCDSYSSLQRKRRREIVKKERTG